MDRKVVTLLGKKQYEQRSKEWFEVRKDLITASSAAALITKTKEVCEDYVKDYKLEDIFAYNGKSCNPYSSKKEYILEKCKQSAFKGNIATYWGQKYEPVVTDIYSLEHKTEVMEFGLLLHDTLPWLGASPDGITPQGVMIEIKCPYRRKINGITPFYYWIQVQLQLEVCDLDYCDFVEYEFTEFESEEEFLDDETLDTEIYNKGIYMQIDQRTEKDTPGPLDKMEYVYPEKELIASIKLYNDTIDLYNSTSTHIAKKGSNDKYLQVMSNGLIQWKNKMLEILPEKITISEENKIPNSEIYFTPIYWKVTNRSIVRIARNKKWFSIVKPILEKEHRHVMYYKSGDNYKQLLSSNKLKELKELEIKDPLQDLENKMKVLDLSQDTESEGSEDEEDCLF